MLPPRPRCAACCSIPRRATTPSGARTRSTGAPGALDQLEAIKQKYTEGLKSPEAAKLFGDTFTRRIEGAQDQISRKVLVERQTIRTPPRMPA